MGGMTFQGQTFIGGMSDTGAAPDSSGGQVVTMIQGGIGSAGRWRLQDVGLRMPQNCLWKALSVLQDAGLAHRKLGPWLCCWVSPLSFIFAFFDQG